MLVSLGVLAHNEASDIGNLLLDIGNQDLLSRPDISLEIHVVANGCTDATVSVAKEALARKPFMRENVTTRVHDIPLAGKSNAWNELIHKLVSPTSHFIFLADADIRIPAGGCLGRMLDALAQSEAAIIAVDESVKDLAMQEPKSIVERLILAGTGTAHNSRTAIAGGLYCARYEVLKTIRMPIGLPGEDGYLRAMILTSSFTAPENLERLVFVEGAYHIFESERHIRDVFRHNLRLVIGTGLNALLFEYLRGLRKEKVDLAFHIGARNAADPNWLNTLIEAKIRSGKYFIVNKDILWRRLYWLFSLPTGMRIRKAPVVGLGMIFDITLFFVANRMMRRGAGAGFW